MSTEYRMACTGTGPGHSKHNWVKKTEAKADQSVIDANHHAAQHPDGFYNKQCAPYVAEQRAVSAWSPSGDLEPAIEVTT